jgi:hypothetical protein
MGLADRQGSRGKRTGDLMGLLSKQLRAQANQQIRQAGCIDATSCPTCGRSGFELTALACPRGGSLEMSGRCEDCGHIIEVAVFPLVPKQTQLERIRGLRTRIGPLEFDSLQALRELRNEC